MADLPDDTKLYRWGPVEFVHRERFPKLVGRGLARWSDDSPFGVPGVDCRSVSYGSLSATSDPQVPERFGALRELDGEDYEGQLPERAVEHGCQLVYPSLPTDGLGRLFTPMVFEDRWVLYQRPGWLYFVSTFSGQLWLAARAAPGADALTLTSVWATPLEETELDPPFAVQQVDFLVKSHALDRWCPHPVPPELRSALDPEAIAQDAWLTHGRRGLFATTADTTRIEHDLTAWPED